MSTIRHAETRGRSTSEWLTSRHTFSFGDFEDPEYRRFHAMRVLNDDVIAAGAGFDAHDHGDVEIVSYIVRGRLAHRDSSGTSGELRAGDVQRITAGRGLTHEEYNASDDSPLRLVQIWFEPERTGLDPSYAHGRFGDAEPSGFELLVSPDGRGDSVSIASDVHLHRGAFAPGDGTTFHLPPGRHAWFHVVDGEIRVDGFPLAQGDGAAFDGDAELGLRAETGAEVLVVDTS